MEGTAGIGEVEGDSLQDRIQKKMKGNLEIKILIRIPVWPRSFMYLLLLVQTDCGFESISVHVCALLCVFRYRKMHSGSPT